MSRTCLLARHHCGASEFQIQTVPSSLRIAGLEDELACIWTGIRERSLRSGLHLWDGQYYRAENLEGLRSGSKTLALSTIPYSIVRSLIEYGATRPLPIHQQPLHINTGALVRTNDGLLIFGQKGGGPTPLRTDLIGGGLQFSEREVHEGIDLEDNMRKEIGEEINISKEHIVDIAIAGILLTETMSLIFLFEVRLAIGLGALYQRFNSRHDLELYGLTEVSPDHAWAFLAAQGGYFPALRPFIDSTKTG